MLDSNQALTWIVFDRDRKRFAREFPELTLEQRSFLPWFSYLMSGGVNLRTFFPKFLTAAEPAPAFAIRITAIHDYIRHGNKNPRPF